MQYLYRIEETEQKRDLGETVSDSSANMEYVYKDDSIVQVVTIAVLNDFKKAADLTGKKGSIGLRSELNEVFNEFVYTEKVPSDGSSLKYEAPKVQGCIEHRDVDSNFCTAILILHENLAGRLQVRDSSLPESSELGDVVLMDPTAINWFTKIAREKDKKASVLSI